MEYGDPLSLLDSLMTFDAYVEHADPEVVASLLAARTKWEQMLAHWDTPILDPIVAGVILGTAIGATLAETREGIDDEEYNRERLAHLWCVWKARQGGTLDALPPDPDRQSRPLTGPRRMVAGLLSRLLLRALRVDRRVLRALRDAQG